MKNIFKSKFFTRLGWRNLVVVAVVLMLGAAVYINYRWFYEPVVESPSGGAADAGNQVQTGDEVDYYAAVSLSRQNARDEALEVLQAAVDNPSESVDVAATLAQISAIAETIEAESNIETLVKSCGFEKCLAVINGESASVIVSAGEAGLAPSGVAQITAIVYEQAGILPANLTIIEK